MQDPSDSHLMQLVQAGQVEAFSTLVQRYQQILLNFFVRMGALQDEAEDLVQETFLRLFQSRINYRRSGKFKNFLYTLARHVWFDRLRQQRKRPSTLSLAQNVVSQLAVESNAPDDSACELQMAINALSEKLRVVVVMNIYQGLRYQEIAQILDIPVGTVKSRMFLAMQRLKESLNAREMVP